MEEVEGKDELIFPPHTNSLVLVQCSLQRAPPCQNKDELGPVVKETSATGGPWDLIRGLNIPHSEETLALQPPQPWHPWCPARLSSLFSSARLRLHGQQTPQSSLFLPHLAFSAGRDTMASHWSCLDVVLDYFFLVSPCPHFNPPGGHASVSPLNRQCSCIFYTWLTLPNANTTSLHSPSLLIPLLHVSCSFEKQPRRQWKSNSSGIN